MPRPPRCRRICGVPQVDAFCPNGCENTEPILLTLDEYEVIRLVDLEQQTHEQCAALRTAIDKLYGLCFSRAFRNINAYDLGDNLAPLLNIYIVADV